jgi:hypothetical protein
MVIPTEVPVYTEITSPPSRRIKFVSPGYFRAMGTGVIAGRDITWSDIDEHRAVVVVSEMFARELWREPAAAIGKRIREWGLKREPIVWREIIGVVKMFAKMARCRRHPPWCIGRS